MNVQNLLEKMRSKGIAIQASNGYLRANSIRPLTDDQLKYLKQHKTEILKHLADMSAANQSRKRYAYRFTLLDDQGGGTYHTDAQPAKAKQELIDKFVGRELEALDLLN